ncbi:hypothetical protein BDK51DRAFT_46053 [Blyttiomyces helicus]|uniref:Ankyrin repeat-containing domain protein n=1 Tax=Blyttiomyces helicus TaxID=388810 RepID=A0A4P9W680_9FUNG|nr:hypothetical protein BDK51DRAFT_46053 [Blyttiomyces helicus]|eukprot:RKO87959.1 hypothetical protein BDK51DRAFT_46053 [Blyttiomyces helicus]
MVAACRNDCIELVRLLLARYPDTYSPDAIQAATHEGNMEILRILYEAGKRLSDDDAKRMIDSSRSRIIAIRALLWLSCAKCIQSYRRPRPAETPTSTTDETASIKGSSDFFANDALVDREEIWLTLDERIRALPATVSSNWPSW